MSKPVAYFENILTIDVETSGMASGADDPSYNPHTGDQYQIVSIGLIVANTKTLQPVESLYLEIKWDGVSKWDAGAQKVHGLSLEYLEENGVSDEEAVIDIAGLILKYWGPTGYVSLLGHNVATFDQWFLKRLLRKYDLEINFSRRHVDTSSLGFGAFESYTSDQLFESLGMPKRENHNAMEDAKQALASVRSIRYIVQDWMQGE